MFDVQIPPHIRVALRSLTMVEEMLCSPILPIMSVFRLPNGTNLHRGHVANFPQDTLQLIRELPRLPQNLPFAVVRREGENNNSHECRVNRERVASVLDFLMEHHPGFRQQGIVINEENLRQLPQNGIPPDLREIVDSAVDQEENEGDNIEADLDEGPVPTAGTVHFREAEESDEEVKPVIIILFRNNVNTHHIYHTTHVSSEQRQQRRRFSSSRRYRRRRHTQLLRGKCRKRPRHPGGGKSARSYHQLAGGGRSSYK